MNIFPLLDPLIGTLIGAVVTWLVTKRYYVRSSRELEIAAQNLRNETDSLKKYTNIILDSFEAAGWFKYVRDESGERIALKLTPVTATMTANYEASASASVNRTSNYEALSHVSTDS